MAAKNKQSLPASVQHFPIVGIGASAGGLDAFKKLLGAIPLQTGMAYVLVQHLSPSHPSLLPEILSRFTELPVHEITDEIKLVPDHIYIIPENSMLTVIDGVLKLMKRDPDKKNQLIDIFFQSLAEIHKSFARGVVLSGTSFDGTQGLKAIKEYGGVTFAQDQDSATFDGMPQSAIDASVVDFILPPELIPQKLVEVNAAYDINYAHGDGNLIPKDDDDIFKHIIRLLRLRTGNDFSHYKQATIRRRIARRMVLTKVEELSDYLTYLKHEKKEQDALFDDILIPVSYFFRDIMTFQRLTNMIFPTLFANQSSRNTIRVWVAGCSTGEEAYSLAICLHEFLGERLSGIKVQIFASDISENVINKARAAVYTKQDLQNVSETRLQEYFTKVNGAYHIKKNIRDMCVFAVHNFVKDPPFAKVDIITCRNVLIYMDAYLQKKALTTFHYALNDNGTLVLGKSETTSHVANLFSLQVRHDKIYSRTAYAGRMLMENVESEDITQSRNYLPSPSISSLPDFQKIAYDILITRYTPCGVIVNEHNEIVHVHGDTGTYLMPSPGKPNFNVLKMAREGLSFELRNALHKVKNSSDTVKRERIQIQKDGSSFFVDIEIVPLPHSVDPHFLILFQKTPSVSEDKKTTTKGKDVSQLRIEQLEKELSQLRQDIISVTEDQEAANEELQSANEELLSSTEELQTLNEELETSTEELRSNNEELISINEELQEQQELLSTSKHYSEAIFVTIREPLIVLDQHLRVMNANPAFYKYFGITHTDDISILELNEGQWNVPELRMLLENILPKRHSLEDFEITISLGAKGKRTLLINARKIINNKSSKELILLAVEDITEDKVAHLLRESEERFRTVIDTAPALLWLSVDTSYSFFNKAWLGFTGNAVEQEQNDGWIAGIHPEDRAQYLEVFHAAYSSRKEFYAEYRLKRHDGQYRWILDHGVPRFSQAGKFMGYVGGCLDIQNQKNFSAVLENEVKEHTEKLSILNKRLFSKNRELEENNSELASFSFVASHDLQEPLRKIDTFVKMIISKENEVLSDTTNDYLQRVSVSVNRMKELIQALLDYSRTNTHKEPMKIIPLQALLAEVKSELSESIEEKQAVIVVGELPEIPGIEHQLKQLFSNLIGNALKYSKEDIPPHIRIAAESVAVDDSSDKRWKITVTDNGIGFEQKYAQKIFELFQRLHGKNEYAGTGIGLGICKKIVLNHDGVISAEGKLGVGSTFTMLFPES